MLILCLNFLIILLSTKSVFSFDSNKRFIAEKNTNVVSPSAQTAFLIASNKKFSKFQCLEECMNTQKCLVAVFERASMTCMMYSKNFASQDKTVSSTSDLYIRHFTVQEPSNKTFLEIFQSTKNMSIVSTGFTELRNFEFLYINNQYFLYAADRGTGQVKILDENWNIIRSVAFAGLIHIKLIQNVEFFITTDTTLYKSDVNLNLINTLTTTQKYHQIAYDPITNILYLSSPSGNRVDSFNRNLNFLSSNTEKNPFAIAYYAGQIYINDNDKIRIYTGTNYIRTIDTNCMSDLFSTHIDKYGYVMAFCLNTGTSVFLHANSGTRIFTLTTPVMSRYFATDVNGRCFISGLNSIYILNQ